MMSTIKVDNPQLPRYLSAMITREQCRAARALIDWTQAKLSEQAGVSVSTIKDFESGKRSPNSKNLRALEAALEADQIELVPENGSGAGVRLKKAVSVSPELTERMTALGNEFGTIYFHAECEWLRLLVIWRQYINLFGHSPKRVSLLNESAGSFFYQVDSLFFEAVLLAICRLNDSERTGKKGNLSVKHFAQYMDGEHKTPFNELLEAAENKAAFARDWRNRRISHNDLKLVTEEDAEPLAPASRKAVDAAIDALFDVFSFVSVHFMRTDISKDPIMPPNGEFELLKVLHLGNQKNQKELNDFLDNGSDMTKIPSWLTPED